MSLSDVEYLEKQQSAKHSPEQHLPDTGLKQHLPELRILFMRNTHIWKSKKTNILGSKTLEFERIGKSVKKVTKVAGRKITLVEAPEWNIDVPVDKRSDLFKHEMVLSVTLCPPGPHAVLVEVNADRTFTEEDKENFTGYLKLFGEELWSHTVVLFTHKNSHRLRTIDQKIKSEGNALQWLVEKCGNRYHFLNKRRNDETQVTELLEKIEEMVAENSGRHFEMDPKILEEVKEEIRNRGCIKFFHYETRRSFSDHSRKQVMKKFSSDSEDFKVVEENIALEEPILVTKVKLIEPVPQSGTQFGAGASWPAKSGSDSEAASMLSNVDNLTDDRMIQSTSSPEPVNLPADINMFSPEVGDAYRFCCHHAGLFQCEMTNLVFEMEGKGEVLYKMVTWDNGLLDGLCQMQPAGPLYSIDCFEGSISRLHLPHCQILAGENQTKLAVTHFTGSNIEIIQPREVTNTHVIFDVQDLSCFGLLIDLLFSAKPIVAQILLFYEEMPDMQMNKLNVHLLPQNVPVMEVQKQHQSIGYITTSSKCHLTPGKKYRLSCEPHEFQPKVETFDLDYGPNFHPTFEVLIKDKVKDVRLGLLKEGGQMVWEPRVVSLKGCSTNEATSSMDPAGAEFVKKHREKLIQKVTSVMEILDILLKEDLISVEMYENIRAERVRQEKMRLLLLFLSSKAVKQKFYMILKEKERDLVDELEFGPSRRF